MKGVKRAIFIKSQLTKLAGKPSGFMKSTNNTTRVLSEWFQASCSKLSSKIRTLPSLPMADLLVDPNSEAIALFRHDHAEMQPVARHYRGRDAAPNVCPARKSKNIAVLRSGPRFRIAAQVFGQSAMLRSDGVPKPMRKKVFQPLGRSRCFSRQ